MHHSQTQMVCLEIRLDACQSYHHTSMSHSSWLWFIGNCLTTHLLTPVQWAIITAHTFG